MQSEFVHSGDIIDIPLDKEDFNFSSKTLQGGAGTFHDVFIGGRVQAAVQRRIAGDFDEAVDLIEEEESSAAGGLWRRHAEQTGETQIYTRES